MNDSRPRNNHGQFAAQDTGGLDPQSMAQAYDPQVIAARKQGLLQRLGGAMRQRDGKNSEGGQAATEMERLDARVAGVLKEFYRTDQPRHARSKQYADPTDAWARNQNLVNADGSEWKTSSPQLANAVWNKAKKGRLAVVRGSGLVGDAVAVASGKARERDASGRVKKREWEKAWFRNALITGGLAAGVGGVLITRRYARTNPGSPIGKFVRKAEAGVHAAKKKAESVAGDVLGGIDAAVQPDDKWQRRHLSMNESQQAIGRLKEFAEVLKRYGTVQNLFKSSDMLRLRGKWLAKQGLGAGQTFETRLLRQGGILIRPIAEKPAKLAKLARAERFEGVGLSAAFVRLKEFAQPPTTEVWRAMRAHAAHKPGAENFIVKAMRERKERDIAKLGKMNNRQMGSAEALGALKEFGSAGMMRQSRVLAALARENSPAHIKATTAAYEKVWQKTAGKNGTWKRAAWNPEKIDLTEANRFRISSYQSRLGIS